MRRPTGRRPRRRARTRERGSPQVVLAQPPQAALLDLVDSLIDSGVSVDGELVLALADVDLVYLRLSSLLCAADRVLPNARPRRRSRKRRA